MGKFFKKLFKKFKEKKEEREMFRNKLLKELLKRFDNLETKVDRIEQLQYDMNTQMKFDRESTQAEFKKINEKMDDGFSEAKEERAELFRLAEENTKDHNKYNLLQKVN